MSTSSLTTLDNHEADLAAITASRPTSTTAQNAFTDLTDTIYAVAREIAVRMSETLPGLAESFTDKVLVVVGGDARGPLGHFAGEKWRREAHRFHELHVNVGHFAYAYVSPSVQAEDVLDTIIHELTHFFARENNIRDTSGRGANHGRYHNKRFAVLASALGLRVMHTGKSYTGYTTVGLTETSREFYADLLVEVEEALRLTSVPQLSPEADSPSRDTSVVLASEEHVSEKASRYVFAQCACSDKRGRPRTVRMARGWWEPGTVGCGICREVFTESQPSAAENHKKGRAL